VAPPRRFLDLGSGGGVPGLILALEAWPSASALLLDAQARRVAFLTGAIEDLGLADRVAAVQARAEELAREAPHRGAYDVVTARSFGPPAITAECAAGFVEASGTILVAEPPDQPERWPADGLAQLGLVDDGPVVSEHGTVRRLRSVAGPQPGVPRRSPAMTRAPRF
jgi:16S rRNA (guanine527-N7)-methyltransferase